MLKVYSSFYACVSPKLSAISELFAHDCHQYINAVFCALLFKRTHTLVHIMRQRGIADRTYGFQRNTQFQLVTLSPSVRPQLH